MSDKKNLSSSKDYPDKDNQSGYVFVPTAGISLGGESYLKNDARYEWVSRRMIDLDILRYGPWVLSLDASEIIILKDQGPGPTPPSIIRYEMDYGNLGREFEAGILSLYFDHICDNAINRNNTLPMQLRWYGAGLKWETYGLRPGRKDVRINFNDGESFEWLNSFNYRVSASRALSTRSFDYGYMFTFLVRYDIFRYRLIVPYMEALFTGIVGSRAWIDRRYEGGLRLHLENADVIPYFSYQYKHDTDIYNGHDAGFYFYGIRMESLLGSTTKHAMEKTGSEDSFPSLFPGIHFSGGYAKFLFDGKLNYNTDFLADLDIITISGITPFVKARLVHNSIVQNAGMFPRYMYSYYESGLSLNMPFIRSFAEPFYRYSRYDEGNFYNGFSETYHAAGLRVLSPGMKTGRSGSSIPRAGGEGLQWLNNLEWLVSSDRIFKNNFYGYTWEHELSLRWDLFRIRNAVTYLMGSGTLSYSEKKSLGLKAEAGERFYFPVEATLYYQFGYESREDPGNGIYRYRHLFGLRIEI